MVNFTTVKIIMSTNMANSVMIRQLMDGRGIRKSQHNNRESSFSKFP